ncbi:MAG: Gfo/Idh/MocA family oxidoreductase [Tannerellaceae bacterium]|jgi:predicted dehydrogenase|nr:Gfo/Idh/MocA family oxidoreductase [Tannerellaceae bacterium]
MKTSVKIASFALLLLSSAFPAMSADKEKSPLRLAVAGLSHGHLAEVVRRVDRGDFIIVGVYEADKLIRENSPLRRKVDGKLFYADLGEMLDKTKPEAVVAYGSTFEHLSVTESCAPRGIHIMVEKPLAVSSAHARRMAELARKHNIFLLTNYETTWYATNHEARRLILEGKIGDITRINVYDGHQGPIEIGCSQEFLSWLTDPVENGGGAVMDFGCYGANLATWLLKGSKPVAVQSVLQHQKPDKYPKVDDDATILVQYPDATVLIMASWNWPMNRKDMHIYGTKGYIYQDSPTSMRVYESKAAKVETVVTPAPLPPPYNDSFYYLKAAVRGEISVRSDDLSSLENNLTVIEILDRARQK